MQSEIEQLRQTADRTHAATHQGNENAQIELARQQTYRELEQIERRELEDQIKQLQQSVDEANAMKRQFQRLSEEHRAKGEDLQIELIAIRGLYKNATDDIAQLQSQGDTHKQDMQQCKQLIAKYRDDLNVIQAQVCGLCNPLCDSRNRSRERNGLNHALFCDYSAKYLKATSNWSD